MSEEEKKVLKNIKNFIKPINNLYKMKDGYYCCDGRRNVTCAHITDLADINILLNLIEKYDKMIDLMAEDYSKYQLRRSCIGEITETAYGIKTRISKEIN